jgi:hypothetical protein
MLAVQTFFDRLREQGLEEAANQAASAPGDA